MPGRIQNSFHSSLGTLARIWLAVMIVIASIHMAHAEIFFGEPGLDDDEEETPKVKKEMPFVLPAFPREENLLPFQVSPTQTQEFFIDNASMSVGEEEIRYTMVSKSRAGAVNVTYEGMKCSTFEIKRYAYGYPKDGKWTVSKHATWRPIQFYASNRPHATLAQDYFCEEKAIAGKKEDMLFRIKYNRSIKNKNTWRTDGM